MAGPMPPEGAPAPAEGAAPPAEGQPQASPEEIVAAVSDGLNALGQAAPEPMKPEVADLLQRFQSLVQKLAGGGAEPAPAQETAPAETAGAEGGAVPAGDGRY